MVGIEDSWLAYQFDLACLVVGKQVEAAIMEGMDVSVALGEEKKPQKPQPGRFRSGMAKVTKKIKIPESGIW